MVCTEGTREDEMTRLAFSKKPLPACNGSVHHADTGSGGRITSLSVPILSSVFAHVLLLRRDGTGAVGQRQQDSGSAHCFAAAAPPPRFPRPCKQSAAAAAAEACARHGSMPCCLTPLRWRRRERRVCFSEPGPDNDDEESILVNKQRKAETGERQGFKSPITLVEKYQVPLLSYQAGRGGARVLQLLLRPRATVKWFNCLAREVMPSYIFLTVVSSGAHCYLCCTLAHLQRWHSVS
jgi:hypothetical protein